MSQPSNKQARKRQTRANRRAAEAAAQKAREEQAARERKQQTTIGVIVVIIIVALIAIIGAVTFHQVSKNNAERKVTPDQLYSKLQKAKPRPANANSQGGFLISEKGMNKKVAGAPTVEIYMDPLCPGCGSLHRQIDDDLQKMVNAGQINLVYHFMNFLDQDSTDHYSSRASGAVTYIASHDSDTSQVLGFVANLYEESYQPKEGSEYQPTSDAQIKEQAIKAGVPQSIANKAFGRQYDKWITAANNYTIKRSELASPSGTNAGSFSSPVVTVNGKIMDMAELNEIGMTQKQALLKELGIKETQIGQSGEMPSIGAKGKPIALD
ncbi:thioredoxin domain-containing protein [Bifidobacterium sp. ESL0763]|uniref:DsbA family protein n=1 Tax=Bifidobacterium sp. ESL0763 TaxID=2983227 RepID=UPI0023F8B878|nr:thioredoxin domain-containing protein [Bifidobacterium sp. ESL0763]MDF7663088.1 thioredoxin domain-containing protein [Bifidobacterium sp. ESL0763]